MSKFKVGEVVYWKGDDTQNHPMTVASVDEKGIDVTFFSGGYFQQNNFDEEELSHPNK